MGIPLKLSNGSQSIAPDAQIYVRRTQLPKIRCWVAEHTVIQSRVEVLNLPFLRHTCYVHL